MSSEPQWAHIIEAVARPDGVVTPAGRADLLGTALSLGADVVPDLIGCSVTQAVDTDMGPGFRTPVASNQLAIALDRAQYALDDGPCVAACRDGQSHNVPDMDDEEAFRGFTKAARAHGVHSSLSLPLAHSRPSALNLYAGDRNAFADPQRRAAAAFLARCVAGLLPESTPVSAGTEVSAQTSERRDLIERACTVLMSREGGARGRAFHRLTVLSREQQRSVFDIARSLVAAGDPA